MIDIRNPLKIKHLFIGITMLSLIGLGACRKYRFDSLGGFAVGYVSRAESSLC